MEKITLSTQLINSILAYLGTRPYQESFQLIEAIQKEAKESVSNAEQQTDSTTS